MGNNESSEAFDTNSPQTAPNERPVWDRNTTEAEMAVIKKQHVIRTAGSYGTYGSSNGNTAAAMEPTFFILHQVSEHDTIAGVALRYGVMESVLRRNNPLIPADPSVQHLKTLNIPVSKSNATLILNATKDRFPPPVRSPSGTGESPAAEHIEAAPAVPEQPESNGKSKEKGKKTGKESDKKDKKQKAAEPEVPKPEVIHSDTFVEFTVEGIVVNNFFFPTFQHKVIPYSAVECWQQNTLLQLNGTYTMPGGFYPTATRTLATHSSRFNKCILLRETGTTHLIVFPIPAVFDAVALLTKHCGAATV